MADLDLSNLRPWLDEQENYANSIKPDDPRTLIAQQMLAIISEARGGLLPSADSTANYVPNKQIIEQLSTLRDKAEQVMRKGRH
ncbi:MAG: hypothetical protein A3F74_15155 [Betaproteobacteria bacterium RIFCSPLOWO2_12_FULL_62_58]|nr:MAG: hypothetical protein A3F74_15155 [Betaproteobacteria bacterium RIFCSPLOWO2_12_FULL_62_58]